MGVGKGVAYWSLNGYWIQHRISSEHWKWDLHLTMIQILKLTLVVRNMFTKRTSFKTLVCFCFACSSPSRVLVTTSASTGFNGKNRFTTGSSASPYSSRSLKSYWKNESFRSPRSWHKCCYRWVGSGKVQKASGVLSDGVSWWMCVCTFAYFLKVEGLHFCLGTAKRKRNDKSRVHVVGIRWLLADDGTDESVNHWRRREEKVRLL